VKDRAVVVAVAGDAGGAAAVGPVIAHLRAGGVEVIALAYRQAASAWGPRGIAFDQLDEQISEDEVDAMLHRHGARALLTGTSVNGVDLERMFTRVCNRSDVPSVAVLDMWSTYSARFGAVEGKGADVPSRIAVMDSRARDAMLGEGFSAAQVVVTGHPGFDDLLCAWDRFGARERSESASRLACPRRTVYWCSRHSRWPPPGGRTLPLRATQATRSGSFSTRFLPHSTASRPGCLCL